MERLDVDHYSGARTGPTTEQDCWTETVTAVPRLDGASIWGETARSSSTGTVVTKGSIGLRLTAVDTVELCQSESSDTRSYRYSVVRWPYGVVP